jgi:hypothetical protein
MVGMGAAITALAMGDHMLGIDDFAWAGAIVGLVISSLLFLVLLFVRGRRPHRAFFVAGEPLPAAPVAQPAPEAQPGDANGTAAGVETQEQVGRPDETMTAQLDESPDQPEAKAG